MILLLIVVLLLLTYLYVKLKYFTLRGPLPGLSPHIVFGNLIQSGILLNGVTKHEVFPAFRRRFGKIYQFWLGPSRVIVVGGINDIQHIFTHRHVYDQGDMFVDKFSILFPNAFISAKGAQFKRFSSVVGPIFRRGRVTLNKDLIEDYTDRLLAKWRVSPLGKIHTDIVKECQDVLLQIFGFIAFDYDLQVLDEDDASTPNPLTQALRETLDAMQTCFNFPSIISRLYLKFSPKYKRNQAIVDQYYNQILKHKLADSSELNDRHNKQTFIGSLISSLHEDEKVESMKSEQEKKGISQNELRNLLVVFLTAGFETTASAVSWFIYYLSKAPRVQQKLKEELLNTDGGKQCLSVDRLNSLVYLDAVVNEILRLAPPIEGTFRTLTDDDTLPESGAQLRKGEQVYVSFNSIARDPEYWSIDPELFYPERFLEEDKSHHQYAFLPFGSGHRQCLGQDFARFELKVIFARLMQHVTFGDGGPELNAGGYITIFSTMPKRVGVTINFD